ncbi:hypothetical protein [Halorussus caseinilyticus]|uniref:Uncharacterized protein n=1 Tax=Halorussus caseinilyticus TaxID=3034025 RepID=A0ABD5WQN7_9EURY|nr:hypothetical protein [Halorussus sp. DT72]
MDSASAQALTDALSGALGDGLRTVAVGNVSVPEYEIIYMRPDIDELYTEEMRENILQEIVFEHIAEARNEDLFPPLAGLEYTVRIYEQGMNLVGWTDDTALFVGLDPDEELLPTAIEVCRQEL